MNKLDMLQDYDMVDLIEMELKELLKKHDYDPDKSAFIRGSALNYLQDTNPELGEQAIEKLLELKARTNELGLGPPIREINEFINSELERHGHQFSGQGRPDIHSRYETRDALNQLVRKVLKESNQEK